METTAFRTEFVGSCRWKLVGELDIATALTARARLRELDGDIEVDGSGLTFVDAAGANLFVELHRLCACRGAKLVLVNPSPCMERLFELCGLDEMFNVRFDGSVA
jgi:anti-anti-sigma factor